MNHSSDFVHPKFTFLHTNTIERQWRSLKASVSTVKVCLTNPDKVDGYLDAYMLRRIIKEDAMY